MNCILIVESNTDDRLMSMYNRVRSVRVREPTIGPIVVGAGTRTPATIPRGGEPDI
jgi:hypothetical protein